MKYSITETGSTKTPLTYNDLEAGDIFIANGIGLYMKTSYLVNSYVNTDPIKNLPKLNAIALSDGTFVYIDEDTEVKKYNSSMNFNMVDFIKYKEDLVDYISVY